MKPKLLFLWYFHHFNEHAVYMPVIIITNKALMPFNGILRACIIVIAKNADIWPSGSPFPTLFKVSPIICLIFLSWRCTSDRICVLQSLLIPFVNAGTFFWQLHHKTRYSQQAGFMAKGKNLSELRVLISAQREPTFSSLRPWVAELVLVQGQRRSSAEYFSLVCLSHWSVIWLNFVMVRIYCSDRGSENLKNQKSWLKRAKSPPPLKILLIVYYVQWWLKPAEKRYTSF